MRDKREREDEKTCLSFSPALLLYFFHYFIFLLQIRLLKRKFELYKREINLFSLKKHEIFIIELDTISI